MIWGYPYFRKPHIWLWIIWQVRSKNTVETVEPMGDQSNKDVQHAVDGCEMLHHQKDGWKPINNGIYHLSTGAGFLRFTIWRWINSSFRGMNIHLPALMWTTGYEVLTHPHISTVVVYNICLNNEVARCYNCQEQIVMFKCETAPVGIWVIVLSWQSYTQVFIAYHGIPNCAIYATV